VGVECIRQSDPRLPIDSKINGVLLNPVMLDIPTHITWLFDFDSLSGRGGWYRLETIKLLRIRTISLTNALELVRSPPTLHFSFYVEVSWACPRPRQEMLSSFHSPDIERVQVDRPTDEAGVHQCQHVIIGLPRSLPKR